MQYQLTALLAALAISAWSVLGVSLSENVAGSSRSAPLATPRLASSAEAFSAVRALRAASRHLRALPQKVSQQAGRGRRTKLLRADTAVAYGISPISAQAINKSASLRHLAANAPLHRGEVHFEAPSGKTFTLLRPAHTVAERDLVWALVDIDNVVADFSGGFADEMGALTGLPRSTFPRNNFNYDMREAVAAVQAQLRSGKHQDTNLRRFKSWLMGRDQLQTFLEAASSSHTNFTLLHHYLIEQGFYARMPVLAGARDGIAALHQQWPIRIVTKRFGAGPESSHLGGKVPLDSVTWIAESLGESYDSLAVMSGQKIDFAGNVHAVFEDSIGNIADIRAANASTELRERAFARGVSLAELDDYLARHNADVLGIAFDWNYNKGADLLDAMNVVTVDRWSDAVAVALAYRKLLTEPQAGASGRLHWGDVAGLVDRDGHAIPLPNASFLPN